MEDSNEHTVNIINIFNNLEILKKVLEKDQALSNMLSDMINNIKN
jgi:hypothetical protein